MAKQRPTLGTFASPTSQLVQPIQEQATPLNEQAIRDAYSFADSFSELSQAMGNLYVSMKQKANAEEVRAGQEIVNSNRKTYADLVKSGEINPSENPWMAVGAQAASGVLESSKARAEFQMEYDRRTTENPELLKDNQFFDALAASFAQNKKAEFGTAQYLNDSFFDSFNPYLAAMGMKHSENIVKYRQGKIIQSLRVKVDEIFQDVTTDRGFGKRMDGSQKDIGWEGAMYDLDGNVVTEKSVTFEFDDSGPVEIPMIVPGLSVSAKEKIVYENATLDDLPIEDQKHIIDHALGQMKQGRTPFFDTEDRLDQLVPELQAYMDEMGANMGMPRTANLTTAAHLVEAMKGSGTTYLAEDILGRLKGGTGTIKDTEEVKAMLTDAREDIDKVRFEIQHQREKTIASLLINKAYRDSFDTEGEEGYEASWDALEQQLLKSSTISVEERGKILDQFNERWNNGAREGRESLDRGDLKIIRRFMAEDMERYGVGQMSGLTLDVANWQGIKLKFDEHLRTFDVEPTSAKAKDAEKKVRDYINERLGVMNVEATTRLSESAMAFGLTAGDERLSTLDSGPKDPVILREAKQNIRIALKTNEIMAAIHFGLEDRLSGLRSIATSGISVDVERGIRPELADLVYMYRTGMGGQIPLDKVFGTGPAGNRMKVFLRSVSLSMDNNMNMDDAVRDAAQQTNMVTSYNAKELLDLDIGGQQLTDIQDYLAELSNDYTDSYFPFSYWDDPVHPDSITSLNSMFTRRYFEVINQTGGAHETALEEADKFVRSNTHFIRNAFIPKGEFDAANVSSEYLVNFIDMEAGPNVKDAALVLVGYGGNGQGVFALRTPDGSAVMNRYYTTGDITNNDRPRDERGEVIEGALSMRERVFQRMGSAEASKRLSILEIHNAARREGSGKPKF